MINKKSFQEGFTLLEVMVAVMVLTLAILGTAAALNSSMLLKQNNRETAIAMNAARQQLSALEQYNAEFGLDSVYTAFKQSTFSVSYQEKDDAGNTQIRAPFAGVDDGPIGTFEFPDKENGLGNVFDETIVDPNWGMPRDLNGDTDATDKTVTSTKLELLPVRIVIKWKGHHGARTYKLSSILYKVN